MRHIFHEILARYLNTDQFAFDTSPRELWPDPRPSWHPQSNRACGSPNPKRGRLARDCSELERHR
jgi:hypothetical protein